jgi:transaldolase / glucose-6-phosphate isomerase
MMTSNPLRDLEQCDQSVWLDSISREILSSGTLKRLIEEDGISGVTANPTIFEKAVVDSHDYDATIKRQGEKGASPMQIYEELAVEDVGQAADLLRPIYDRTGGADGFVSIEVSPEIAFNTQASIEEACRFWIHLHRPNVFIKIPATPAGIPAIEHLIGEGINVNITLIFAVEVHEEVMEAYLRGLEHRMHRGESIDHIASVASFFVSRVDTLIDSFLEERGGPVNLKGKAAVANAKIAYQRFEEVFSAERFKRMATKGARVQRPLWASTSTKNPNYPDTMYVTPLIGPNTVNTMPMETIEAFRDHGEVDCEAIRKGLDEAYQVMKELKAAGIDMKAVTDQLTKEGVEKFTKSLHTLLEAIAEEERSLVRA